MIFHNWLHSVAILLVVFFPSNVVAQGRDIRLNPEPAGCVLPDDIRIESAAQHGQVVLAVWGGLLSKTDSSARNILWSQIINDGTVLGAPTAVHSDMAEPFGVVGVMALQECFLVVWNDKRGGESGIYVQAVGVDGARTGSEERISEGRIIGMGQVWLHQVSGGEFDLIWNDPRGIYARRFDENGSPVEPERKVSDGAVAEYLSFTTLPGYAVLRQADGSAIVIDSDGASADPIPAGRLNVPYYLSNDQSLLLLHGDTLHHYAQFSNQHPTHSIVIPRLQESDTAFRAVVRDSAGRYGVVFAEVYFGEIYLGISYTLWIDDNWEPDTVSNRQIVYGGYNGPGSYSGDIDSVIRIQQCDNSTFIRIYVTSIVKIHQYPHSTSHYQQSLYINPYGIINQSQVKLSAVCDDAAGVRVVRFSPINKTGIYVNTKDTTISVTAALDYCHPEIYNSRINIRNYNSKLLVTWERGENPNTVSLGEWVNTDSNQISLYSALSQPSDYIQQYDKTINILDRKRHNNVDVCVQENIKVAYSYLENDWFRGGNSYLYLGNNIKWLNCLKKTFSGRSGNLSAEWKIVDAAFDPNNSQLLISLFSRSNPSQTFAVNYLGEILWNYNFAINQGSIVPIDSDEFYVLLKDKNSLLHYRYGQIINEFSIPSAKGTFTCQRLLGQRFLRLSAVDTPATQFILDLFDLNGELRYSTTITPITSGWHPTVVEYPADNSLMLMWGSPAGVRMCHFTRDLNLLRPEFQASEHPDTARYPAAAFRNDTMFLAWERTANAVRDLMGTIIKRNQISDVPIALSPVAVPLIRYIHPIPASSQLQIGVNGDTPTTIHIYDLQGISVMATTVETQETVLDVASLATGIYIMVAESGVVQERRMVAVMR